MAQPAFQLTALDVRRFDFGRAWRGFDREHVERFRGQVAEALEALTRQVQAGEAALRAAQEELAGFRERERSLSEALVSAQQLRTDLREQAEREAQVILREAQVEAERQRQAVREELRRAEEEVQAVWRARRAHITRLRQHLERQLSELNAAEVDPVPSLVAEQVLGPPPAPDPEPPKAAAPPPPWLVDDVDQ